MTLACDVEESAGGAGHPQVAGAGVEDHGKLLARRADLNLAIVLGLTIYQQKPIIRCNTRLLL